MCKVTDDFQTLTLKYIAENDCNLGRPAVHVCSEAKRFYENRVPEFRKNEVFQVLFEPSCAVAFLKIKITIEAVHGSKQDA